VHLVGIIYYNVVWVLTFMGPCIVIYFYSKTNYMHNFSIVLNITLHVSVFPSIIRSSRLYIQHQVYVIQVSWMLASKQSTKLCDIYLTLYVQSWTPDDGWEDRQKHVEWYKINSKFLHQVGFTVEIYQNARSHGRQFEVLSPFRSCLAQIAK
jgi:hypothetical protein